MLCPFSFNHCVVCPLIYGFWLSLVIFNFLLFVNLHVFALFFYIHRVIPVINPVISHEWGKHRIVILIPYWITSLCHVTGKHFIICQWCFLSKDKVCMHDRYVMSDVCNGLNQLYLSPSISLELMSNWLYPTSYVICSTILFLWTNPTQRIMKILCLSL
jgi:hypothetical protein